MNKEKLFFLDQHGCAKNQVDGELIVTQLASIGWKRTEEADKAALIIVNSCGFIKSAKEDSLNSLFYAKNSYPNAKILLSGCLAERYAENFRQSLPEADGVFGNGDISKICDVVKSLFEENSENRPIVTVPQTGISNGERIEFLNLPGSAYIKITEGCDNVCSFCAIPLIRGRLRSRPIDDIVSEINSLLKRGIFEFNLIGQDLASYGYAPGEGGKDSAFGNFTGLVFKRGVSGSVNFALGVTNSDNGNFVLGSADSASANLGGMVKSPLRVLLEKISEIKGDFWIRLLYIHPDNFPLDILEVIKKDKRILPYFDIPFQSGDDSIIRAMNRHGSASSYVKLVQKIRTECEKSEYGDCAIRTTFLCGFPGETDENALNTKRFLSEIQSDWSGCFAYSREEDTPAYSMKNQVPAKKAQKRCDELNECQSKIIAERLSRHVGKVYRVLIEEIVEVASERGVTDESFDASERGITGESFDASERGEF